MHSKVTDISEDRIKEHFIKRFSGWLEGLGSYKNALKKGGGASAPSLDLPMTSKIAV